VELSEAPLDEEPVWYYLSAHEEILTHPHAVSICVCSHWWCSN